MQTSLSTKAQELLGMCLRALPVNDAGKIYFAPGRKPVECDIKDPAYTAAVCWEVVHELRRRGLKAMPQIGQGVPEPFIRIWSESVLEADAVLNN
jgi:hypothetical protein